MIWGHFVGEWGKILRRNLNEVCVCVCVRANIDSILMDLNNH
jgi:hypothetical protein